MSIYNPTRLTMISLNICRICGNSGECFILRLQHLSGWYYCNNCRDIVRNSAIKYTEEEMPIGVLINMPIYFKRSSGELWIGVVNRLSPILINKDNYLVNIVFNDTIIETQDKKSDLIDYKYEKYVSFNDICEYTPEIYYHLITCNNLFFNDLIIIGFSDLPDIVKTTISERPIQISIILKNWNGLIQDIIKYVYNYLFGIELSRLVY